jgi:RHS repeat-associated protein
VLRGGRRLGLLVAAAVVFQTVFSTGTTQAAGCTPTHFIVVLNQSGQIDGSAITHFKASAANNQNNVCTGWSGSVTFSSNDPAMQVAWNSENPATASSGVAFINLVPRAPGSITVTATSGSLTGFATYPVGDTRITLGFPSTVQAGVPANMTITAVSAWTGLTSTSFYGSLAVHTGETSAEWYETKPTLDPSIPKWDGADNAGGDLVTEIWHQIASSGTVTYKTIFYTPGPRSIFAYDQTRPSNASPSQVLGVLASTLVVTAPASVEPGAAASVQVEARNASDQLLTGFEGQVRLTSSDPAAAFTAPNPYRFLPADSGTHAYAVTLSTVGSQTVTATGTTYPSLTDTATIGVGTPPPPSPSDFRFSLLAGLGDAALKASGVASGYQKYKAVDGDTSTRWSPNNGQGPPAGHYWAADAGAAPTIVGYRLAQLYAEDTSATVDIYGSNDPAAWSWLPSGKISAAPAANGWTLVAALSGLPYPSDTGVVGFPGAAAYRYWLFHATDASRGGSNEFDINEVELWAPFLDEPAPDGTEEQENGETGGDPVQTFSGALLYRHTDLAIPGRGPAVQFGRAYNSADTRSGPLGPGWTHSYNVRLRGPGDSSEDQLLVRADGNTDRFTHNPDGTFSPPPAVYASLVRNPDGSYLVTERDQRSWAFDPGGRLTAIGDRFGNTSTLTYDIGGRLATISDPAGRGQLTLAYGANGRLLTVSDWLAPARTVTYGYDASGRLQTVTDREGKITTFAYDGTTQRIAAVTDARGNTALTNTYDTQGRVLTQKDARGVTTGDVTTFAYVVNPDGTRVTTLTAPATSFEPTFNPTLTDSYDANGWLVERITRPNSSDILTQSFTYDIAANRTSVTDARGNRTDFCYDVDYAGAAISGSRGNLTRIIGPPPTPGANRPVTLTSYDAKNNVVQTVAPKGVPSGTTASCTTDLSAIDGSYATDLAYDASGAKLVSTTIRFTDPDAGAQTAVTKFEYSDAANPGRVTKLIPPRGNSGGAPDYTYATTFSYFGSGTQRGMLARVSDALGNATTYQWDAVGRLASSVDALGNATGGVVADHTTTYVYDKEDRLRFVSLPAPVGGDAGLVSETRYDEVGNPIVRIDASGQVTTFGYDPRNSLFQVKESPSSWSDLASPPSDVITTEYTRDAGGGVTRITRAKSDAQYERVVDYVFDGRGLPRQETQYPVWPSTTETLVTGYTYDPNGNRLSTVDPLGRTTTIVYDARDLPTSIDYSEATTPDVGYTYDANGNRTSLTDGTGVTSYAYDEANRLTSVTSPGPKTVAYRYDLDGNRTRLIYPDATAVTYSFNKGGQLSSLLDWASRSVSYTYAVDGLVQTATNPDASAATYSYDNARRLVDLLHTGPGAEVLDRQIYTLDAIGNVAGVVNGNLEAQLVRPDGFSSSNGTWTGTFADINEMTANDANFLASPSAPTTTNYYEVTLPDATEPGDLTGIVVRYRYAKSGNNAGQTTNLTVQLRQGSIVIASQLHSNIPGVSGSGWQSGSFTLTEVQANAITDFTDLRLRFNPSTTGGGQARQAQVSWAEVEVPGPGDPDSLITYTCDRLYRLTGAQDTSGARSYTYDPVGNRLSADSTAYTYDRADRMTAAGSTSITVDANGNLIAKGADTFVFDQANRLTTATVGSDAETYLYDGDGTRFSRQVGVNPATQYVSDAIGGLPVTIDDGTRKYVYGLGLAYAVTSSSIEVYHTDRLGSVRALTDGSGSVTGTYRTDEWGVPTGSTGGSTQPFGFTGEPSDGTGLTYLRARYYDPELARFTSRDVWPGSPAIPQTLDRYSYVANNPTTRVDPSGHCGVDIFADLGFIGYDIHSLVFGPEKEAEGNWLALAADVGSAFIPCVTGAGFFVRGGVHFYNAGWKILEGARAIKAAASRWGLDYDLLSRYIERDLKKYWGLGPADNVRILPNGDILPPVGDDVLGNVFDILE